MRIRRGVLQVLIKPGSSINSARYNFDTCSEKFSHLSFLSEPLKQIPLWNIFQDQQDGFRSDPVAEHTQNIPVKANLLH